VAPGGGAQLLEGRAHRRPRAKRPARPVFIGRARTLEPIEERDQRSDVGRNRGDGSQRLQRVADATRGEGRDAELARPIRPERLQPPRVPEVVRLPKRLVQRADRARRGRVGTRPRPEMRRAQQRDQGRAGVKI
jgi:hypothetical protein